VKLFLILSIVFYSTTAHSQADDSLAYTLYKDKIVLYSDLGFSSSPFRIKDNFLGGFKKIKYKHNQKVILGIGVAYKWFALRLGLALPGTLRPGGKFGNTNYFDLGVAFTIKKTYWDINLRNFEGYAIQNANQWDDSLTSLKPNEIKPRVSNFDVSINSWYFKSDEFRMQSVFGRVG
jgi:hypothetical protein